MPQVGQDIPKGKLVEWTKAEGDAVEQGEVVLIVESEKSVFEVEAPRDGVLLKRLFEADDEAPVLEAVGFIGDEGEEYVADEAGPGSVDAAPKAEAFIDSCTGGGPGAVGRGSAPVAAGSGGGTPLPPQPLPGPIGRIKASPAAKKAAAERGIDLARVTGTGPGGRIKLRDLPAEGIISRFPPVPASDGRHAVPPVVQDGDEIVAFDRMRQVVADRLTLSKQTIPHFYLTLEVDMGKALAWRKDANLEGGQKITINDLVVCAVSRALRANPQVNAHVAADRVVRKAAVNVGIAVAVDGGLVVPVLPAADALAIRAIAAATKDLVGKARRGVVDPNVVGSFTISNLGTAGVDTFTPIINPPECALLGVAAVKERVVARDGAFAIRPTTTLTLACDHRAVDGVAAAPFLQEVKLRLEGADFS